MTEVDREHAAGHAPATRGICSGCKNSLSHLQGSRGQALFSGTSANLSNCHYLIRTGKTINYLAFEVVLGLTESFK